MLKSFVSHTIELSVVRLFKIISDNETINNKSVGEIWHVTGNVFKELRVLIKESSFRPLFTKINKES